MSLHPGWEFLFGKTREYGSFLVKNSTFSFNLPLMLYGTQESAVADSLHFGPGDAVLAGNAHCLFDKLLLKQRPAVSEWEGVL